MDHEFRLTEDGLILPPTAHLLESPEDFDRGPNGVYHEAISRELAEKMVRPWWYVIRYDAGGIVTGSRTPGESNRIMSLQAGLNPDERTWLMLYGRLKEEVSSRSAYTRQHVGEPGQVVFGYQVNSSTGETWNVDLYNDGSGYAWTIQQDPEHREIGLAQRHPTGLHAAAAAIKHLQEDGVEGLIPIMGLD